MIKSEGVILMNHEILGWVICGFLILSCSYSLIKRCKSIRSKIKVSFKKLLDYHCFFSILATILAFIHVGGNLGNIRLSTGYVSLLMMVLVTLIGIIMKYFKKTYLKHRMVWLYLHILLTIILIGSLSLHIFSYLLLQ